jgi:hypothetical protein
MSRNVRPIRADEPFWSATTRRHRYDPFSIGCNEAANTASSRRDRGVLLVAVEGVQGEETQSGRAG